MTLLHRKKQKPHKIRASALTGSLLILLGFLTYSGLAAAQENDPFSSLADWQTVDEFTKKKSPQASVSTAPQQNTDVPPQVTGQNLSDPGHDKQAVKAPVEQKDTKTAHPEKTASYPVLPAEAHGQSEADKTVVVSSTADANVDLLAPEPEKPKWQNVEEHAQEEALADSAEHDAQSAEPSSFKIRFATLPSKDIKSIPGQRVSGSRYDMMKKTAEKKEQEELTTTAAVSAKKTKKAESQKKTDPDYCETLVDLRRRQLDAIESDRKTLSLLRSALADLGLTDRLSFMTDSSAMTETDVTVTTPN